MTYLEKLDMRKGNSARSFNDLFNEFFNDLFVNESHCNKSKNLCIRQILMPNIKTKI